MKRLVTVILALLCWLAPAAPQALAQAGTAEEVADWKHYYGYSLGRVIKQFQSTDWQGAMPSAGDISGAAEARLNALRARKLNHIAIPGFPDPDENTPYRFSEIAWSGIYSLHRPDDPPNNVVLLLVNRTEYTEGPVTARSVQTEAMLEHYVLDRDPATGAWTFPDDSQHMFTVGAIQWASQDELIRQYTASLREEGYVPGLSNGSGVKTLPGAATDAGATGAAGGILSAPPPPGLAGIDNVPGPATMGQAMAGVVIPGLVIILVNTLAGLPAGRPGGGAPVPGSPPPPDAAEIEEARARAQAQADWLKQREEDLRQVREQKSYVAATAAGTGQAGFDTSEHARQIEALTRREKELTEAIAKGGGDTSYVASVRDTVKVGAGFTEAIRIAQDFDKAQALAAARARMEQLEKDRAQIATDYWKDVREGFWDNMVKDVDAIPGQLQDAAITGLKTIGTVVGESARALADPANWRDAATAAAETVRDIVTHPVDSAARVGGFYGGVAKAAGKAAHHAVTHPVETIKGVLGADNWEKAFDPNVPVTERIARTVVGIFDAAATITGAKAAIGAGRAAATGLAEGLGKAASASARGARPAWAENRFSSRLMQQARDKARLEQIGGALEDRRYTVTEDPLVKVEGIGGKLAGSKGGLLSGMTEEARRHAQMVTDRYGVKLDIRPTNDVAHDLIKSGQAVPKAPHCKSKTINEFDIYLGADPADAGKAGYFRPREPSPADLERLSPEKRTEIMKRYKDRMEEYKDQAEHIEELTREGKVTVKHGVVYDGPTGKPYTGDHDLFDIRDATTGRPLPRYQVGPDGQVLLNPDGTPRLNPVREQIIKELQQPPMSVQHGAHMDWKYDHLPNTVPTDASPGTKSDFEIARGIDRGVTGKHKQGGQPLITFVSGTDAPVGSWFSGER